MASRQTAKVAGDRGDEGPLRPGDLILLTALLVSPGLALHRLSTFMGHVDPSSTAVYLTITTALLHEANRRFERFAEPAWTQAPEAGR